MVYGCLREFGCLFGFGCLFWLRIGKSVLHDDEFGKAIAEEFELSIHFAAGADGFVQCWTILPD